MSDPTEEDIEAAALDATEDAMDHFEQFMGDWDATKKRKFENELFDAIYNFTEAYFP